MDTMSFLEKIAQFMSEEAEVIVPVLAIFGWGRKSEDPADQPLDLDEMHHKLDLGIEELVNADSRNRGENFVPSDISLEDLELAAKLRDASNPEIRKGFLGLFK